MNTSTIRKGFRDIIAGGATASAGILSLAGMFLVTSSLYVCIPVFVLAVAYEAQVNQETIGKALRRIFDPTYLGRKLVRQYIEKKITDYKDFLDKKRQLETRLALLNDTQYMEQIQLEAELADINAKIQRLEENAYFNDYYNKYHYLDQLEAIRHPTENQQKLIKTTQRELRAMERYLLLQLNNRNALSGSRQSQVMDDFLLNDRDILFKELQHKTWLIRMSWLFALGGGVSAGLSTVSAGYAAIGTLTFLSFVPGGFLVTLGMLAAVGYTLLLYHSITDMIQTYGSSINSYFKRRDDDSNWSYGLRCVGIAVGIGLAIVATFATAGTWWIAAKEGAELLKAGGQIASLLRTVSVSLMVLPTFIFGAKNAVESIDKISRSDYGQLVKESLQTIQKTWQVETIFQFVNPFRLIERLYTGLIKSALFIGHLVSGGFMTDQMPLVPVPPVATAALIAGGEGLTHANYLPNEKDEHEHASLPLKLLFGIVAIPAFILKGLAVLWDACATRSFTKSYDNIFSTEKAVQSPTPVKKPDMMQWNTGEMNKKFNENRVLSNQATCATVQTVTYNPLWKPIESPQKAKHSYQPLTPVRRALN